MEEFLAVAAGALLGMIGALLPGLHVNTICSVLLQTSIDPFLLSVAIVALSTSYAIFEVVPAVFLSVPDSTIVTVLPGHRLLMDGKGAFAVRVWILSALAAVVLTLLLLPLSLQFLPFFYEFLKPFLPAVLLGMSVFLLASEREPKKIGKALFVFLSAGALGLIALNLPFAREPLFPMFSGMFAFAGLLLALNNRLSIPPQSDSLSPSLKEFFLYVAAGVGMGMFADLLPAISSPAQLAVLASPFLVMSAPSFLAFISSINISHALYAFFTAYSIGKSRTGAAVAVSQLIGVPSAQELAVFAAVSLVSVSAAAVVLLLIVRSIASYVGRVPTARLNISIMCYLAVLIFLISGANGLFLACVSASLGVLPPLLGVRRTHLMGALLLPTLFYFFGLTSFFVDFILG